MPVNGFQGKTELKFVTDGLLLKEMLSDPLLERYRYACRAPDIVQYLHRKQYFLLCAPALQYAPRTAWPRATHSVTCDHRLPVSGHQSQVTSHASRVKGHAPPCCLRVTCVRRLWPHTSHTSHTSHTCHKSLVCHLPRRTKVTSHTFCDILGCNQDIRDVTRSETGDLCVAAIRTRNSSPCRPLPESTKKREQKRETEMAFSMYPSLPLQPGHQPVLPVSLFPLSKKKEEQK